MNLLAKNFIFKKSLLFLPTLDRHANIMIAKLFIKYVKRVNISNKLYYLEMYGSFCFFGWIPLLSLQPTTQDYKGIQLLLKIIYFS